MLTFLYVEVMLGNDISVCGGDVSEMLTFLYLYVEVMLVKC